MRIGALGRTSWLYDSILAVVEAGHEIVFIGTCKASPEYSRTERDFEELASRLGCPYFLDASLSSSAASAALSIPADAVISVNWLSIVPAEVLDRFPHGLINAHPGDLPRYRGNAAPNWAILNGEGDMAVSLHRMTPELDSGPVLAKQRFPLGPSTYVSDTYRFLEGAIPAMFVDVLGRLERGERLGEEQPVDPGLVLRGFPRTPADGAIDWRSPALSLSRLVRACAEPFAGAYTYLDGEKLVVWRAHDETLPYAWLGTPGQVAEVRRETGEVAVLAGDGVLVIEEVETSEGRMAATEAIRSARARLGMDLEAEVERLRGRLSELGSAEPVDDES